jgi:NADH:ubiquinone oxidoreductase subunit
MAGYAQLAGRAKGEGMRPIILFNADEAVKVPPNHKWLSVLHYRSRTFSMEG